MAAKARKNSETANLIKMFIFSILGAALSAGILLVLTAVLLEKMGLNAGQVQIMVYGIYLLSSLTAGLIAGKWRREKKFMWGVSAGILWMLLIFVISLAANGFSIQWKELFPAAVCILGGGMLGGMLA